MALSCQGPVGGSTLFIGSGTPPPLCIYDNTCTPTLRRNSSLGKASSPVIPSFLRCPDVLCLVSKTQNISSKSFWNENSCTSQEPVCPTHAVPLWNKNKQKSYIETSPHVKMYCLRLAICGSLSEASFTCLSFKVTGRLSWATTLTKSISSPLVSLVDWALIVRPRCSLS